MGLEFLAYALEPVLRQAAAVPGVVRPTTAPLGNMMLPRKQAAGNAVLAAWRRLQAARAQADASRSRHLSAAIDRLVDGGRSGRAAHDRRLAAKDAASGADAALQTLQLRQAEFAAAVREFYAAARVE